MSSLFRGGEGVNRYGLCTFGKVSRYRGPQTKALPVVKNTRVYVAKKFVLIIKVKAVECLLYMCST